MMRRKIKTNAGFIALMSTVIISVILLLIAVNLSQTSFFGRFNILDAELKEKSSALAEACADTALLKLVNNPSYFPPAGGESVSVDGNDCIIESVSLSIPKIINVQTDYKNYITKFKIEVDPSDDMAVVSWEEI